MSRGLFEYLEDVCGKIKYKTVHTEIRKELTSHIEDAAAEYEKCGYEKNAAMGIAISHMGNGREVGEMFNSHYRMPFNCSLGLMIWAAAVTALFYFFYPLLFKIYNGTIKIPHNEIFVLFLLLAFMVGNWFYLRRGLLKISLRDSLHISAGFLLGWAVSAAALMGMSAIGGVFGQYLYFPDVKLMFAPPYLPLLPKTHNVFGVEFFCWWFCLVTYMVSVRSKEKVRLKFAPIFLEIESGRIVDDPIAAQDAGASDIFVKIMKKHKDDIYADKNKRTMR